MSISMMDHCYRIITNSLQVETNNFIYGGLLYGHLYSKKHGVDFWSFFRRQRQKTTCRIGRWSPRSRTPGAAPTAPRAARPLGAAPALDPFVWKGFCHCNLQLCFSYVKHDPLNHDQGLRWQKFHEVMVDHHDTRPSRPSARSAAAGLSVHLQTLHLCKYMILKTGSHLCALVLAPAPAAGLSCF